MGDSDAEAHAGATPPRPTGATLDQSQDELMRRDDSWIHTAADVPLETDERSSDAENERLETHVGDSRRRTLSPTRAALLQSTATGQYDGEMRRDTVSPGALATVLRDAEVHQKKKKEEEEEEEKRGELGTSMSAARRSETTVSGVPAASEVPSRAGDVDRGNESSWMDGNTADSLTGALMETSTLLEQEGVGRRTTLDPMEAGGGSVAERSSEFDCQCSGRES